MSLEHIERGAEICSCPLHLLKTNTVLGSSNPLSPSAKGEQDVWSLGSTWDSELTLSFKRLYFKRFSQEYSCLLGLPHHGVSATEPWTCKADTDLLRQD